MMQLRYRNVITALKGEMIKLKNRLSEANTDLEKFSITIDDQDMLLITLATHQEILQMKTTHCNDILKELHIIMEYVASEEKDWTMEYLTAELEQTETQYEGLCRNF